MPVLPIEKLEEEINAGAQILQINKDKDFATNMHYSIHVRKPGQEDYDAFENVGEVLLFQCLVKSNQFEEFVSAMFGNDLKRFIENGYQIREYHMTSLDNFMVTVVHATGGTQGIHVLCGVKGQKLAECLKVSPEVLALSNAMHFTFHDALQQGYKMTFYQKHEKDEMYKAQLCLDNPKVAGGKMFKWFGNLKKESIASGAGVPVEEVKDEFGTQVETVDGRKKMDRQSSYSPNTKQQKHDLRKNHLVKAKEK